MSIEALINSHVMGTMRKQMCSGQFRYGTHIVTFIQLEDFYAEWNIEFIHDRDTIDGYNEIMLQNALNAYKSGQAIFAKYDVESMRG